MPEAAPGITPTPIRSTRIAVGVTLAVLVLAGVAHRSLLAKIQGALGEKLEPIRPLSTLPLQFGTWQGRDVPIPDEILRVPGMDDDHINRLYDNSQNGRSVGLYVGFIGRPRSRLGHRPDLCYPAHGFEEVSQERIQVTAGGGAQLPSVLLDFRSLELNQSRDLVLATYVVNGQYTNDPQVIGGYNARSPHLFGRPAGYVARIQITVRASGDRVADVALLRGFASQAFELIGPMMPRLD